MLCRIMTVFLLAIAIQTNRVNADTHAGFDNTSQEVSAMQDEAVQQKYNDTMKRIKDNNDKADTYSNCPYCPME